MTKLYRKCADLKLIGGTRTETWALRACLIQGTQQIYVALLWYWGSSLTRLSTAGVRASSLLTSTRTITAITTPIAVFLWAVGLILFFGLPKYYRQTPGKVPSFYTALLHRKVVLVRSHIPIPQGSEIVKTNIKPPPFISGSLSWSLSKTTGSRPPTAETG